MLPKLQAHKNTVPSKWNYAAHLLKLKPRGNWLEWHNLFFGELVKEHLKASYNCVLQLWFPSRLRPFAHRRPSGQAQLHAVQAYLHQLRQNNFRYWGCKRHVRVVRFTL